MKGHYAHASKESIVPICHCTDLPLTNSEGLVLIVTGWGWASMSGPSPEQYCANLQCGTPLVFQDVQADAAQLVYVRVVDLCQEANLRRTMLGSG